MSINTGEATTDKNRRRFGKADDELVGWHSAAIGVQAQRYESSGGGSDPNERHYARLRAMQRGSMAWFDAVGATLALLPASTRVVLDLVYRPHGWPTWLADALSTPWGGGSFVALAASLPRAAKASDGALPLPWLVSRGRGGANERESKAMRDLYRRLRADCEAIRLPALRLYDEHRIARVKREQAAEREAKREREERNRQLLEEELSITRRIERARFERRVMRTRVA